MKSQQEIQQILDDSELKSEYRRQLSDAIKMAMDYHGTETEYKELFKTLIELEEWLKEVFGTDNDNRFPIELEEEILEKSDEVSDDTWADIQRGRKILRGYKYFRVALKDAEKNAYEVEGIQERIFEQAKEEVRVAEQNLDACPEENQVKRAELVIELDEPNLSTIN